MSHRASEAGRAATTLILVVVVAAVAAFLFVADPLGLGIGLNRSSQDLAYEDRDPLAARDGADAGDDVSGARLQGRFGAGDLGEVRLRLLEVESRDPVPGQTLTLASRAGGEVTAVSGENGVTVFSRLAPGRGYRLGIRVEGYAGVTVQGVKVLPGETTDLGDILLGSNVVVRGRVLDSSGRPLPGTAISVFTPQEGLLADGFMASMTQQVSSFPPALEEQKTDPEGWFALQSLPAGKYRLEARHGGYATRIEEDVVVSEDRPARDLTIVLGDGATVKGKVVDSAGSPVAGARVVAVKDPGQRRFFQAGATLERDYTVTDAKGAYVLDTLMRGMAYRFGVLADGYSSIFETEAVEIENEIQTRDFQLVKGGAIRGRVVRKADGEPIADALVVVGVGRMGFGRRGRGGDGADANMSAETTRTDDEGRFVLPNVLPGPVVSAQIKASGYVPYQSIVWAGESWGEVPEDGVLEVPAIELAEGGSIMGVVADATSGTPIPRAQVMVVPRQRPWQVFMTGAPQARANDEGTFVVAGVEPGEYGLVATAPGYAASDAAAETNAVSVPEAGGAVTHDVVLQRSASVTGIVADSKGTPIPGARVRSRVAPTPRDEQGNRGGRGADRMAAFLPGGSGVDITDEEGRFVIPDVSPDRRWIVTAEADDFVPTESDPFQVQIGETREVNIVLVGGGNLSGRVVDDRGAFVEGARVRVGQIPDDRARPGRLNAWEVDRYLEPNTYFTDTDGRFTAYNLPPGRAVVKVEHEGFVTYYKRNAEIRPDETTSDYVVTLSPGETMAGVVKGADGQPLQGAMVAVTKDANPGGGGSADDAAATEESDEIEPRLTSRTDRDGKFEIEHVPPGEYNVVVWFAPGHQGWARDRDEGAIRRNVDAAARNVEFKLTASTGGGGGFGGGGRGGDRGGGR